MDNKNKLILAFALLVAFAGILGSMFWGSTAGVIALLALGLLIVVLQTLQRRQLAKVQERLSVLIRQNQSLLEFKSADGNIGVDRGTHTTITKIFDMLQAQQVSTELLAARMDQSSGPSPEETSQ